MEHRVRDTTALRDRGHRFLRPRTGLGGAQSLNEEITGHERLLGRLVDHVAPRLTAGVGIGPDNASELLLTLGENAGRVHSEAAFARLCGACPIPASTGKTVRHRLNRGGHRSANAALHRIVIVGMKYHEPTRDYVTRRIAEGKTKPEIMRCLKRFIAREIWSRTQPLRQQLSAPVTT